MISFEQRNLLKADDYSKKQPIHIILKEGNFMKNKSEKIYHFCLLRVW